MNLNVQNKRFREEPEYLVKRLRESDENAFAFLLDTYGKSLYFYCNSILKNDTFAEDIVQESFVRFVGTTIKILFNYFLFEFSCIKRPEINVWIS